VIVSNQAGQATLREQNLVKRNERERAAEADPRVKEVLARFPGARIVEVRKLAAEPPESDISGAALSDDEFGGLDAPDADD
jgi:DNA polymerase-3 subunit gamma/tau